MDVNLFDFVLPEDRIALRPLAKREAAKLLTVSADGLFQDKHVGDLADLLKPGDALVFNDTKVIPARLTGKRLRGEAVANISVTLHMRLGPDRWLVFLRPAKRLKISEKITFSRNDQMLQAEVIEKYSNGEVLLIFDKHGQALDDALNALGQMPLPPYIASKRAEDEQDRADYQTVYAKNQGAVAAPTAGLHFTPGLMNALEKKGIGIYFVTLHVGAGTFLPVKVADTADHKMHSEIGQIDGKTAAALNRVKHQGGRIVAVGTTALRLLESAAEQHRVKAWAGATDIFITPGYSFKFVDLLMTNFHLPRSTLFMLVSAFCGLDTMKRAYSYAVDKKYRFYSYGDSSLLERRDLGSNNN